MHQWHWVVARPGAYEADISTGSCHDPVPMLALDIGTGANDHSVPKAGLSLVDISKSLTTPHSYLYPSHFSLPYPLSLKKLAVRAASRWTLPWSARHCRGAPAATAAAERAGSACRHAEDLGVQHRRLGPQLHMGSYPGKLCMQSRGRCSCFLSSS